MNGTAISGRGSVVAPGTDWKVAGSGDYNGDGKSDSTGLIWESHLNGTSISASGAVTSAALE